jgi:hypothetical protein
LLKCIHYFASQFFEERGILQHYGNEARLERKARKIRRDAYRTDTLHSMEDGNSQDDDEEISEDEEKGITKKGRAAHSPEKLKRTMYRTMDGSALMVIGAFVNFIQSRILRDVCRHVVARICFYAD